MNEKYNTVMPESDDTAICIQVDKPISKEGYRDNFLPKLTDMVQKKGEARILVYFQTFQGWEEEAAGFDMEAVATYGKYVGKLAFVNPPEKVIFKIKLQQPMIKGDVQFFAENDLQTALRWIKS